MSLSPRPGQFKVVKLNIDEAPEIGDRYDVRSIPALLVLRDGNDVDRLVGAASRPQLTAPCRSS
jgi:thioredoxin-like negative regulator of GroEL